MGKRGPHKRYTKRVEVWLTEEQYRLLTAFGQRLPDKIRQLIDNHLRSTPCPPSSSAHSPSPDSSSSSS